jgi:DNA repair exonuclease SbcCD ATPase subunit
VIEYALLFGLGFLTAILAGLLLAPAIHARIVKFTEDRILATVPVSPQELRAQKDMVRAEMATQVARTAHDLKQERGKAATLAIRNDKLIERAGRLQGENFDLRTLADELTVEAGELRSSLREEEMQVVKLREQLSQAAVREREKEGRIVQLLHRAQQLTIDIDNLKIDIATRDTEAESFRARINALRDERETLRNDAKLATQRAKDAELRLAREENKAARLEDRLNAEISGSVDKDTIIERRISEITRLKERLKAANADAREAARGTKASTTRLPPAPRVKALPTETRRALIDAKPRRELLEAETRPLLPVPVEKVSQPSRLIDEKRASELSDDARSQANAVSERLLSLKDDEHDDALREEIADIAAKMVAVVAQKEGMSTSLREMISGKPQSSVPDRTSLANRAAKLMHLE